MHACKVLWSPYEHTERVYMFTICSRAGISMWWKCGKEDATCVRCVRWLRPDWRSSWQRHSIWTCLDPHTTGLATTPCARSPLGVRLEVHSNLCVVVCCVMACNAVVLTFFIIILFQVLVWGSSEKALLIVDEKGNYWGIGSALSERKYLKYLKELQVWAGKFEKYW